ncbi:MAG: alpha/beta hydrolase [Gemmatimonadales bacterium]|nr:MAG: alpha/beta hydrolase [Gemmatimonadales bacterium]
MANEVAPPNDLPHTVLVHGAGTGGWVWDGVRSHLRGTSTAVDLPLHEPGGTPSACADLIAESLGTRPSSPILLVLHSWAGGLAGLLAERLHGRLAHVVYLSAVIPEDGSTFADTLPIPQRWILRLLYSRSRDGLRPSDAMIQREYCNDLSEAQAEEVVRRFETQRPEPFLTPVAGPPAARTSTYIHLSMDRSVPPSLQRRSAGRLREPTLRSIDAGHLAMLSRPAEVAAILNEVWEECPY